MTSDHEIEALAELARERGATVTIEFQPEFEDGRATGRNPIVWVQVANLKGVGPYPMSPIAAAERLREVVGVLDTWSSASRQHYIDTGRYLTADETDAGF